MIGLLSFLDESDEIGIINVEPEASWPIFLCDQIVPVTSWTRVQIMNYLNHLEHRIRTSRWHSKQDLDEEQSKLNSDDILSPQMGSFQKAVSMACSNFSQDSPFPPSAPTVIHLSYGTHSSDIPPSLSIQCPIFIDLFSLTHLTDEEQEIYTNTLQSMSANHILKAQVSQGNPNAFALKTSEKLNSKKEWWSFSEILNQFFPHENVKTSNAVEFSLPHWNSVYKGEIFIVLRKSLYVFMYVCTLLHDLISFFPETIVVAKKYVTSNKRPVGLVAVEIPLVHFTQSVAFYTNKEFCDAKSYAILLDKTGLSFLCSLFLYHLCYN